MSTDVCHPVTKQFLAEVPRLNRGPRAWRTVGVELQGSRAAIAVSGEGVKAFTGTRMVVSQ